MANNIRELRLAALLTPGELADRLGVDLVEVRRLESTDEALSGDWINAVASALGVPQSAITDPNINIDDVIASRIENGEAHPRICRIGARFAVQAMIAKLGGLKYALDLEEDALATAVQNIAAYVEDGGGNESAEQRTNRLSQSLQIAVLTILQSRGVDPAPDFEGEMKIARDGALALLRSFSHLDQVRCEPETE